MVQERCQHACKTPLEADDSEATHSLALPGLAFLWVPALAAAAAAFCSSDSLRANDLAAL